VLDICAQPTLGPGNRIDPEVELDTCVDPVVELDTCVERKEELDSCTTST
jgi:hypothetical protein